MFVHTGQPSNSRLSVDEVPDNILGQTVYSEFDHSKRAAQ
ncbi:hypothetical protein MAR_021741 [Mya arenaria]|uniref:Uncharacterized protein n=1 Tax=Mya arenaria TaxID=6604 RepID=A0ABY7EC48_MYAAR|nr:hypothetical protein MAR_021741 [Mya arenaria]